MQLVDGAAVLGGVRLGFGPVGVGERLHQLPVRPDDQGEVRELVLAGRLLAMRFRHGPQL